MNRFVVLDAGIALFAPSEPLSRDMTETLMGQFRRAMPDWKVIVLGEPSEIVDLRGDDALIDLANELHEKMCDLLAEVPA